MDVCYNSLELSSAISLRKSLFGCLVPETSDQRFYWGIRFDFLIVPVEQANTMRKLSMSSWLKEKQQKYQSQSRKGTDADGYQRVQAAQPRPENCDIAR